MVYLEGICMVKANSHVVREQCNEENPKGPFVCALFCVHNTVLPARDSWGVNTAHVSSFVLTSILRGQTRTPPSGENLGVLDYHLKKVREWSFRKVVTDHLRELTSGRGHRWSSKFEYVHYLLNIYLACMSRKRYHQRTSVIIWLNLTRSNISLEWVCKTKNYFDSFWKHFLL